MLGILISGLFVCTKYNLWMLLIDETIITYELSCSRLKIFTTVVEYRPTILFFFQSNAVITEPRNQFANTVSVKIKKTKCIIYAF